MSVSLTHLVILPTFNTGPRLLAVVAEVLRHWQPVLVVVDGSTDGSELALHELARQEPALQVLALARNAGKGAAVLVGAEAARARGFTHALVMDADGQHPAGHIEDFMAASRQTPEAMVLGRPIFPANIPPERLHGRKLSVGLVYFEILGRGIADPLFGFRVYPLQPLLEILGPRRGGRRYDFDTEAAVRLCWAGVPPRNRAAPVRYFSRAEGGVSHFHYLRDNAALVWMHTRLVVELLLRRWPTLIGHRRRWRGRALAALVLGLLCGWGALLPARAADAMPAESAPVTPDWGDLITAFAHKPDTTVEFIEHRFFVFKKEPIVLSGEARVSTEHGLSLHYQVPEERIVILDAQGVLQREAKRGDKAMPTDARALAANRVLLNVLRFDFAALTQDFVIAGERAGARWSLALTPRTEELRRSVGSIEVTGEAAIVRTIALRRSARQRIEIRMEGTHRVTPFTAEERQRYFR